jgi:hypothetical protein
MNGTHRQNVDGTAAGSIEARVIVRSWWIFINGYTSETISSSSLSLTKLYSLEGPRPYLSSISDPPLAYQVVPRRNILQC